jgi:hypothetical protein
MDFSKIKAASVDMSVDDDLLTQELLSIPEKLWDTGNDRYTGFKWKSIFLRKNLTKEFNDFKTAKSLPHSAWYWDDRFDIPYIKSLVESLPLNNIGMIRAFVLDGPLAMHIDSNETTPDELSYRLGLTIASKLEEPMILDGVPVRDKCLLFDDSISHGFPNATGTQISIRIFGDFEYEKFKATKIL